MQANISTQQVDTKRGTHQIARVVPILGKPPSSLETSDIPAAYVTAIKNHLRQKPSNEDQQSTLVYFGDLDINALSKNVPAIIIQGTHSEIERTIQSIQNKKPFKQNPIETNPLTGIYWDETNEEKPTQPSSNRLKKNAEIKKLEEINLQLAELIKGIGIENLKKIFKKNNLENAKISKLLGEIQNLSSYPSFETYYKGTKNNFQKIQSLKLELLPQIQASLTQKFKENITLIQKWSCLIENKDLDFLGISSVNELENFNFNDIGIEDLSNTLGNIETLYNKLRERFADQFIEQFDQLVNNNDFDINKIEEKKRGRFFEKLKEYIIESEKGPAFGLSQNEETSGSKISLEKIHAIANSLTAKTEDLNTVWNRKKKDNPFVFESLKNLKDARQKLFRGDKRQGADQNIPILIALSYRMSTPHDAQLVEEIIAEYGIGKDMKQKMQELVEQRAIKINPQLHTTSISSFCDQNLDQFKRDLYLKASTDRSDLSQFLHLSTFHDVDWKSENVYSEVLRRATKLYSTLFVPTSPDDILHTRSILDPQFTLGHSGITTSQSERGSIYQSNPKDNTTAILMDTSEEGKIIFNLFSGKKSLGSSAIKTLNKNINNTESSEITIQETNGGIEIYPPENIDVWRKTGAIYKKVADPTQGNFKKDQDILFCTPELSRIIESENSIESPQEINLDFLKKKETEGIAIFTTL